MKFILILKMIMVLITIVHSVSSTSKQPRFELEECEELIPEFVDHIARHPDDGECGRVGQFPKPGDCTVFFKCVRSRGRIMPILEYCAIGYVFDGMSCIRKEDATDCPQFMCTKRKNGTDTQQEAQVLPAAAEMNSGSNSNFITNTIFISFTLMYTFVPF